MIIHISYTAKDDGLFKEEVEAELANQLSQLSAEAGMFRWFSLKREFSNALHQLQHPAQDATPATEITLERRHFPYFLRGRELTLVNTTVILKPEEGEELTVAGLELQLNDLPVAD